MVGKRLFLILLTLFWVIFFTIILAVGSVVAQQPDEAEGDRASTQEPTAMPSPSPTESSDQPSTPESSAPALEATPSATLALELTTAGWLEVGWLAPAADVSAMALASVDCTVMSSPVVGFEISRGQDPNDVADFINNLTVNGFSVGTVDISGGAIPPCIDVLIVYGSVRGGSLAQPFYSAADGTLLRGWAASGHGLMIAGEFGNFRAGTEELFRAYGYSQQGAFAVADPTDFDPPGPANSWVIYQVDNFDISHPILDGVATLELLASSSLSPDTNASVTTDADAIPATVPVMAAFTDSAGCVALSTDTNWISVIGAINGYFKADNARVARQMIQWLNGCTSLKLSKLAAPSPVQAGGLLTYTLTARNDSAAPLIGVIITDTVPISTTFVNATPPFVGPDANGVVTWSLGALNPNTSASVTMLVQVDSLAPLGAVITNTAWVTSSQGLTDTATTFTPVNVQIVDPRVTKGVNTSQAQVGDVITFTLTLSQTGTSSSIATNVRVVDPLPPEVNILSAPEVNAGFTQVLGRVITWTIPVLTPADVRVMTIRAQVSNTISPPLTIRNQAILSFDQGPDRLSNQVAVLVPAIDQLPPPPPPPPVPSKDDTDDDDDDDDRDSPAAPAAVTAVPVIAFAATPVPTPVLPVLLLPETGSQSRSWLGSSRLIFGTVLLLAMMVILKLNSKRRSILNVSGRAKRSQSDGQR